LLIADDGELNIFRKKPMASFSKRVVVLALVAGGWTLCSRLTLLAQEEAVRMPKERVSFTAEAVADVPLRKKPPNLGYLFISGAGDTIGVIQKGEKIKVRGRKVIRTFFGDDIWVRVKRTNQEKKTEGWAYFGTPESSPYFRRVTQEE
jgi:hypothetical protein